MPALSATVLLLRDTANGLEVLMVERHHQIDFAAGALVFPGGRLDAEDTGDAVADVCSGHEALSPREIGMRVCAIRETFEEAGILMARKNGALGLLGAQRSAEIGARHRARIDAGETTMGAMAKIEGITLAIDELTLFAHWITPQALPKRFDTEFFLALAPEAQLATHDGRESVDALWIDPSQALTDAEAGTRTLVFATRVNLMKLAERDNAQAAIRAAKNAKIVTVEPTMEEVEGGRLFRIPKDAGYAITEMILPDGVP